MSETKRENGVDFPRAAFAYTPSDNPSEWKLRLWETPAKKETARQVGMAVAALGKGFRGNRVQIPAKARGAVIARVRRAWHKVHEKGDALPSVLRAEAGEDLDAAHTYSTVQLVLDDAAASTIRQRAASVIAPAHVHPGEGLETRPHITVLYGLETEDVADVLPLLSAVESPIEAVVQGLEVFRPDGKDYDVLVHRVACPGAIRVHERLVGALAHVTTHPVYQPHLTLGYVQRGLGGQYGTLQTGLEGMVLRFWEVEFNSSDDVRTTIPLHLDAAIALEAMGVTLPSAPEHPNRIPFEGVLTRVDEASDSAPAGAHGHRVLLPRAVAEAALPSLIGMGVGIDGQLLTHNPQRKVGVILEAWLAGNDLRVRGILYGRDFPKEVAQIQALARQRQLGMSFELAGAEIVDTAADIWQVRACTFTGGAILKRAHAAYRSTSLAAQGAGDMEGEAMDNTTLAGDTTHVTIEQVPTVTLSMAAAATDLVAMQANMDSMLETMRQMGGQMEGYQACMNAMARCAGMRAEMDGLAEALEHLVKMHQALHEMGGEAAVEAAASGAASTTPAAEGEEMDAETKERLGKLEAAQGEMLAAMKLLTDGQTRVEGLITDKLEGFKGLLTDNAGRLTATGNGTVPQRKTLQAQGDYERAIAKYGLERDKGYNEREIDGVLRNAGVTDIERRMAVKMELEACGVLQRH